MPFDETLTVSEVNAQVRTLLEENYPDVSVLGEVSNFKSHSSGHWYFTLKDSDSQLRTVCFRRDAAGIGFEVEDGLKVLVRGRLTVYEAYGQYQLVGYAIERWGAGELEAAFRALKEKLEKEGLFDPTHKRELPEYPRKIAVVTSPSGAAIRDIVSTLGRRWPIVDVLLCPVRVQGDRAVAEIVHALDLLSALPEIDVVIVGRGGGSLEDLWAFNEEAVARAIYRCSVPVISAVGHETDFTIADFVADTRAATPTMAAEMAVPPAHEVMTNLDRRMGGLTNFIRSKLKIENGRLQELLRSYALGRVKSQIERCMQAHDFAMEKLHRRVADMLRNENNRIGELLTRLAGLDPNAILKRGYTVCSDNRTSRIIRSATDAVASGQMRVTFHDGHVLTDVKEKIHERSKG
jgi:exodeoxyribonuclease VII large subunit